GGTTEWNTVVVPHQPQLEVDFCLLRGRRGRGIGGRGTACAVTATIVVAIGTKALAMLPLVNMLHSWRLPQLELNWKAVNWDIQLASVQPTSHMAHRQSSVRV